MEIKIENNNKIENKNKNYKLDESLKSAISDQNLTVAKINSIINHNSLKSTRGMMNHQFIASGVWVFPSFINHSCVPNTSYFGIGDFLFLQAQKHIKKGEEVTIGYVIFEDRFEKRTEILSKNWGFLCNCNFFLYQQKNFKDNEVKLYAFDYLDCLYENGKKNKGAEYSNENIDI